MQYAVNIVRSTRKWPGIAIGSGPRGGIGLIRAARARAVMRHRIALSPEMELEGMHSDTILQNILDKVPAPRN